MRDNMQYAHMFGAEERIWDRWYQQHKNEYVDFDYDIHVGEGIDVRPEWGDEIARMAKQLTMKRIDAVGYRQGEVWIFEVKPHAGLSALGQLIGYRDLYLKKYNPTVPIKLAVVCETIDPDVKVLMEEKGIVIYQV
jgi:hypothetical protein